MKKRGLAAWLIPGLLLVAAIVVLALLLSRCGNSNSSPKAASSPTPTAASVGTPAATTAASPSVTSAASGGGQAGTITAGGATVLPLTGSSTASLSSYADQAATTTSVKVQSVPADEGFWVGTSSTDRVWVQLTGKAGESPYTVKVGDSVTFTGHVIKNAAGFADNAGVSDSEGKAQLDAQGYHIDAAKASLKLAT